jgi:hypothetical protein
LKRKLLFVAQGDDTRPTAEEHRMINFSAHRFAIVVFMFNCVMLFGEDKKPFQETPADISNQIAVTLEFVGTKERSSIVENQSSILIVSLTSKLDKATEIPFFLEHKYVPAPAFEPGFQAAFPKLKWELNKNLIVDQLLPMPSMLRLEPGVTKIAIPMKTPGAGKYRVTVSFDNSSIIRDKGSSSLRLSKMHDNPYYGPNVILTASLEVEIKRASPEK